MRSTTASRMQVVKKDEKEGKIKELITQDIERRRAGRTGDADSIYFLIARSTESPVARAIEALASEIRAAGIQLMAVLCPGDAASSPVLSDLALTGQGLRTLSDARFLEAHEQLVLGTSTVWIGDCMRRDPARRDAYECHADDADEIAACARLSFFRLWRAAGPAMAAASAGAGQMPPGGRVPPAAVNPLEPTTPLVASTRH